ncbi:non-ribosomal peptide synthetase [Chitinophaga japonensis]|uniref:Amino acid adenylation domain-containing protein n=1 Tax=Chitinophaga japonensis TaxID=104662 RepID=A0A562SU74_CHIJA|nr:non-ribosomal peptide synthetase [Chitinophaga japonensis]TWI84568.1 amino acid adenylation domain-containing protein [Chitinophaga japonensis]
MNTVKSNVDAFLELLRESNIFLKLNEHNNLDIEAPQGALPQELLEEIRSRKEEVVGYLKQVAAQAKMGENIPAAPEADTYPLSSAQMRLWLSSNIHNDSAAYNISSVHELEGIYDPVKFEQAIFQVIKRHEILRTVFRKDQEGTVRQWILQPGELGFKLSYVDLSEAPGSREAADHLIQEDGRKMFNLEQAPLFRVTLFRLAAAQYLLYYNMHHIITDAWSTDILTRDVLIAYEALQQGKADTREPLRIQYKDYAVWEQAQLGAPAFDVHRQYWHRQFEGELPVLDLPGAAPRPAVLTHNGYVLSAFIKEELVTSLRKITQQQGGSLFTGLIASLQALFLRYTGQEDIIFGTPVVGREHADLHDQIGFYINTLALRTRCSAEESFIDLLGKVRATTMKAYEHQLYPFDLLVQELPLKRDVSRSLIFDVFVNFQNTSAGGGQENGKDALLPEDRDLVRDVGPATSKFDLIFNFQETGKDIHLLIEFNSDIYNRESIARLIGHYKHLLASVLQKPGQPLGSLSYLADQERERLLQQACGKVAPAPLQTVVAMFDQQVARGGERTALQYEEQVLSYRELDERSNQVAAYLHSLGVKPEELIPVCMNRSEKQVIAIWGILKAGAAYVPLDPEYPRERTAYILSDVNSRLIITDSACKQLLPAEASTQKIIDLDAAQPTIQAAPAARMELQPTPSQLAYVIYTSGSTGVPKGVQVEHAALSNYLDWAVKTYMNGNGKGNMGLYTSLSFDLTVTTLFGTLLAGGCLRVFPQEMGIQEILTAYLDQDSGLDTIKLTPSHIQLIPAMGIKATGVATAIVGGEPLHKKHVGILHALNSNMTIYNEYGPTEATVGCSVAVIEQPLPESMHIGRPVDNTALYILDASRQPVPAGVAGELYIGGAQLARAYLNNATLTAERFIDSPFHKGERLYRTGDLATWLPDGNIEYIGRTDNQVKIRGYRVELGEIEHVLQTCPGVRQAVVLLAPGAGEEPTLSGYITTGPGFNEHTTRSYLKSKLPSYMLPEMYIRLDEFPLTVNGKVDVKQLPQVAGAHAGQEEDSYEAPANEVETRLVEIWKEVLRLYNEISVTANFFELGGHSIKAIKMLNQVSQEFGVVISVKKLFEEPTIRNLAEKILNAGWLTSQQEVADNTAYEKIKI